MISHGQINKLLEATHGISVVFADDSMVQSFDDPTFRRVDRSSATKLNEGSERENFGKNKSGSSVTPSSEETPRNCTIVMAEDPSPKGIPRVFSVGSMEDSSVNLIYVELVQ